MANPKQWPLTVKIVLDVCPRCGGAHGEVEFRRFELGDPNFTHWAICEATGEPLLIDMSNRKKRDPDKFRVMFKSTGRKATQPSNPDFPEGIDVFVPCKEGRPACKVKLPYPAKEVGGWLVECTECRATAACTAAGRKDDPRSITMPCRSR